jgi:hypothetical protein
MVRNAVLVAVLVVLYLLAALTEVRAGECFEDMSCWDGRTMGNHLTGERVAVYNQGRPHHEMVLVHWGTNGERTI